MLLATICPCWGGVGWGAAEGTMDVDDVEEVCCQRQYVNVGGGWGVGEGRKLEDSCKGARLT